MMRRASLLRACLAVALFTLATATPLHAQTVHQRWKIKTSVDPSKLGHPHAVDLADLKGLSSFSPPVSTQQFDAKRIPDPAPGSSHHEGEVLRTTGWLHLIAWEHGASGDGDYHIQLSTSQTDGSHCVIVEIPDPDAEDVPTSLQPRFRDLRQTLQTKLLHGHAWGTSGNKMTHPVHVSVTGQLFYDTSHQAHPEQRGKQHMPAATAWELHPVTAVRFLDLVAH